jgi:hypothetical protein
MLDGTSVCSNYVITVWSLIDIFLLQGVPNMPEKVIMGLIRDDGSTSCLPGTDESGPLPGCLPMPFDTWYFKKNSYLTGFI